MLKRIVKNLSVYSIAPIITGLIGFLLLPIKSNYLSPSDYGILGMVTSMSSLLAIIISLQMGSGILRIYSEIKDEKEKKKYIGSIFLALLVLDVVIVILAGILLYFTSDEIFKSGDITFFPYIFMQLIILFLNQFTIIPTSIFVVSESAVNKVVIGLVAFFIETGVGLYLIIVLKMGVRGLLLASIISGVILLPLYIYITIKNSILKINMKYIKDTVIYSLPFIPACLGIVIYNYSDRYIIERFMTIKDVGIYTFAQTLIGPLSFILSSLDSSYIPNYFNNKNDGISTELINETVEKLSTILGLGIICWVYFISDLRFFINVRYAESFKFVSFLAIFWFFRYIYIFPMGTILYHKRTKSIPIINLLPAGLNVVLNILMVPYIGIYGAVIATVICSIVTLMLTYYFSSKVESGNYNYIKVTILSIIVIAFSIINNFLVLNNLFIDIGIKVLLVIVYLALVNKIFKLGVSINMIKGLIKKKAA